MISGDKTPGWNSLTARLHDLNPENLTNLRPSTTMIKKKSLVQRTWPEKGTSQKENFMIFGCLPLESMLVSRFNVTMQLYVED